ncbi:hypothetical protein H5410_024353 [Solanum commersonii]|uniref:Uncharacterized protein n=1 Tax=Solanum commersonii TaxID=4109 RepID=A0A9J5ZLR6_SOLCO|nr:hypothetical protein H5410_024353 [Solanum commersonii]
MVVVISGQTDIYLNLWIKSVDDVPLGASDFNPIVSADIIVHGGIRLPYSTDFQKACLEKYHLQITATYYQNYMI